MSPMNLFPHRRVLLGACVLVGFGLSGVVLANRPEAQNKTESCDPVDAALLAQVAPMQRAHDQPAGAAMDRALTLILAARRLCENGDIKGARAMYRRADAALTRFQPTQETDEIR